MPFSFEQLPSLAAHVLSVATHAVSPLHGPPHWQRVAEIGRRLCDTEPDADPQVVALFALLHDCQRLNDNADPQHGARAASLVIDMIADGLLDIDNRQTSWLVTACREHTTATSAENPTIAVCYDADRLTLWRVNIQPDPARLLTEVGRSGDWVSYGRDLERVPALSWEELAAAYLGDLPEDRLAPAEHPARTFNRLLNAVEDLHPDLLPWVSDRDGIPTLSHPLVQQIFYSPKLNALSNRMYAHKRAGIAAAARDRRWHRYLGLHEKPYRLDAFLQICDRLDHVEYWSLLGHIWTGSENIYQQRREWQTALQADRPGREHLMNDEDRRTLAGLPDPLTVYRGFHHDEGQHGMSWTMSRERAAWFASRLCRDEDLTPPRVAQGQLARADALAYFSDRGEQEVLALPDAVRDVIVSPA
jgi:Fe-S-cluster formation regulator IscX/YfhJ